MPEQPARNPAIILVEDEPGLVLTLSDLLSSEGYEVDTASDGPSGLLPAAEPLPQRPWADHSGRLCRGGR